MKINGPYGKTVFTLIKTSFSQVYIYLEQCHIFM